MSLLFLVALGGCAQPQNPQDLKEKTAQTTEEIKRDAKAVAAGIREGWNRDKPLDLNSATKEQLLTLPGLSSVQADHIIANRPYKDPAELLSRHIISKAEYDKISDLVKAR
ncbi:MAG: helix-hairpin-helix domain-containing protein [Acidobacteria bacterium]|nr:helix-hairpin-helix domain-containing protein [Acidobacteriota bacterium]